MVYDQYQSDDLSPLGYKCAPPKEPRLGFLLALFTIPAAFIAHKVAISSIFSGYFIPAIITFVLSMVIFVFAWGKTIGTSQRQKYLAELKEWENTWLCMQCNHQFKRELP
jgi:hypothetical protein